MAMLSDAACIGFLPSALETFCRGWNNVEYRRGRTQVLCCLEGQANRHTSFVVAQRISTVLNADKIIVIDEGKIAAQGTHRELMQSSPIYRDIYESQMEADQSDGHGPSATLPDVLAGTVESVVTAGGTGADGHV